MESWEEIYTACMSNHDRFRYTLDKANALVMENRGAEALKLLSDYDYEEILQGADDTGGDCLELYRFIEEVMIDECQDMMTIHARARAKELARSIPEPAKRFRDDLHGGL